jgi:hypothetical protein
MKKRLTLFPLFILILWLAGCNSSPMDTPESAAKHFWQAIIDKDMEKAKNLATWDTVDYLKYLNNSKMHPERFDLGEKMEGDKTAEISVILHTKSAGEESIRVPGRTILIKTEHGWRIDVKKSLGSVIKQSVNNVFDQLNNMMQKGINELDKSFSDSMDEISKGLEEGAKELQRELEKALPDHEKVAPNNAPKAQEI